MTGGRSRPGLGLLCALVCIAALPSVASALATQSLDAGWQFRIAPGDSHAPAHPRTEQWLSATVPGSVQTDLMALKLIRDPYWRNDEAKIQWVGLSNWQYRTRFDVDAATLGRAHVDLVFDWRSIESVGGDSRSSRSKPASMR